MARTDRPHDRSALADSSAGAGDQSALAGQPAATGAPAAATHDASRREFFRTFSRQTVQNAGTVFGAAAELRRAGIYAAREIMGSGAADVIVDSPATPLVEPEDPGWTYRSAYRFSGDAIVLLDQRELPGKVATLSVSEATEVASAIRAGVIASGPVLGEVGAYAMVLAAARAAGRPAESRPQIMRAASGTLRAARREVQSLASALERMDARHDELVEQGADANQIVAALHAEADDLATSAMASNATIGRHAAQLIADATASPDGAPLQMLMHGDCGPLSCGMIGIGTTLLQSLVDTGRAVHVWVTDAAPSGEGSRIATLQLAQADVPHTVIPDAAVAWLLASRRIDAVLLRGDRVCANGDTGALIGSLNVALLAGQAGVPVNVVAPLSAVDAAAASGQQIKVQLASAAEVLAARRLGEGNERTDDRGRQAPFGVRLNPTTDIVPAASISAIITERGVLTAPFRVGAL